MQAHKYESEQIFESLQEGIVVVTDAKISSKNTIFEKIYQ